MIELMTTVVMGALLILFVIFVGVTIWNIHRSPDKPDLLDLITSTDKSGNVRFDARKCWEAGAFAVSTWGFVFIIVAGKMTEWYFTGYMATWVAARFLRDREKRLEVRP